MIHKINQCIDILFFCWLIKCRRTALQNISISSSSKSVFCFVLVAALVVFFLTRRTKKNNKLVVESRNSIRVELVRKCNENIFGGYKGIVSMRIKLKFRRSSLFRLDKYFQLQIAPCIIDLAW